MSESWRNRKLEQPLQHKAITFCCILKLCILFSCSYRILRVKLFSSIEGFQLCE